jgi:ribosomal protein S27E
MSQEFKKFIIIRCPRCKKLQGHALIKLKNRKSRLRCSICGKSLPKLSADNVLFQSNEAMEAMEMVRELKIKLRQKCANCGGEIRKYFLDKGQWNYECVGCGLPMKDCTCRPWRKASLFRGPKT